MGGWVGMAIQVMLTTADVAKVLGVSPQSVRYLIQDGDLRAVRVRNQYRIPQEALDEYLKRNTVNAGTGHPA